ncbi:TPA: hypothetical protein DEP58_04470 [Patescibacteria group bacterium]|nr:MAG: hypothetical protein UU98_C0003G0021 [Parcubacteria group bacterium GW2011_GWD2_42_14]HCC05524.1 hypothetical protein [Patescibacteria group bacterium]
MKDKKIIVGSIFGVVVIALLVVTLFFFANKTQTKQAVSTDNPTDIVLDFYGDWSNAVQSTSTNPYQEGLAKTPILSKTLRDRLLATPENPEIDPVLCQNIPPTKVSSRTIIEEADTIQILVMSKEPIQTGQAVFMLSRLDDGWYIDDILCAQGESGTPGEFSFAHEGGLFKSVSDQSLPDQEYWSILYIQDAKMYTARLLFTADSMCTNLAGTEAVCNPDQFTETKVQVRGEMSENGVTVQQLSFN